MVFFDLRALADAAQLDERVPRVALVLGADDRRHGRLRRRGRARRASGRAGSTAPPDRRAPPRAPRYCSLSAACGLPFEPLRDPCPSAWPITSCMFVVSSPANALHFSARVRLVRRPRELAAELRQRRLVVRLVDVRQRHRLAAVLLADRLVVRQVDADRRDRPRVAGLDHDVDGVGGDALDALLAVLRIPRHAVLEPLRLVRERLDLRGLLAVDVEDERFPRALDAARVQVDLDEAVDRVDRRRPCPAPRRCRTPRGRPSSPVR